MKQREIHNRTKAVTEPTAEPIHLDEAKDHLNWVNLAKDSLIESKLRTARRVAEGLTWRSYELKTYKLYLDDFPSDAIELEPAPVRSVESLEYIDSDGNTQTVSSSDYIVDLISEPARITRKDDFTWPSPDDRTNAVIVTFKAGYEVNFTVNADTETITAVDHWFSDDDIVRARVSGDNDRALPDPLKEKTNYHVINSSGNDLQLANSQGGSAIDLSDDYANGNFYLYESPSIPRSDIDGMLLITGHLVGNREDVVVSNSSLSAKQIPNGAAWLLGLNSMERPV